MSKLVLNALVMQALVDDGFRQDLLNGRRAQRLAEFPLAEQEQALLLSLSAPSLEVFAAQVEHLLRHNAPITQTQGAPPSTAVPLGAGAD